MCAWRLHKPHLPATCCHFQEVSDLEHQRVDQIGSDLGSEVQLSGYWKGEDPAPQGHPAAGYLHAMVWNRLVCIAYIGLHTTQVKIFWQQLAGVGELAPSAIHQHAEAWGMRKLMSYTLRRIKMGHTARVPCKHHMFVACSHIL